MPYFIQHERIYFSPVNAGIMSQSRKLSRRQMLTLCKNGFGSIAFMGMLGQLGLSCENPSPPIAPIATGAAPLFPPKAKSIIFLYMDGGISQVDSFDPKPRLAKENGQNPYEKFKVDATQFNNIGEYPQ